jgi:hypothetical protein
MVVLGDSGLARLGLQVAGRRFSTLWSWSFGMRRLKGGLYVIAFLWPAVAATAISTGRLISGRASPSCPIWSG